MGVTMGREWRNYMYLLSQKLDQDRKPLEVEELAEIEGYEELPRKKEVDEALYYVLVEKTEGDAALRVQSGKQGQGINAYMRVYLWFSGTTGLALSEKIAQLMNPRVTMIEHELADTLEKWAELERNMRAYGEDYELKPVHKLTALRTIMTCKREQFEHMERETKTAHNGKVTDSMVDDLHQKVREYVQQRRLEEMHRNDPNKMHIGGVGGTQEQGRE